MDTFLIMPLIFNYNPEIIFSHKHGAFNKHFLSAYCVSFIFAPVDAFQFGLFEGGKQSFPFQSMINF